MINCSFTTLPQLAEAFAYAIEHDAVMVIGTGNFNRAFPNFPAGQMDVLRVGGIDRNDRRWLNDPVIIRGREIRQGSNYGKGLGRFLTRRKTPHQQRWQAGRGPGRTPWPVDRMERPDQDSDSNVKAFLDLASGQMLAHQPEKPDGTNADDTGRHNGIGYLSASAGDLCFSLRAMEDAPNGAIVCLRGAKAMLWSGGEYQETQPTILRIPKKGTWWFGGVEDPPHDRDWDPCAYAIPKVPSRFRICTAEKKHFDVIVKVVKKDDSEISGVEVQFLPSYALMAPDADSTRTDTKDREDAPRVTEPKSSAEQHPHGDSAANPAGRSGKTSHDHVGRPR